MSLQLALFVGVMIFVSGVLFGAWVCVIVVLQRNA